MKENAITKESVNLTSENHTEQSQDPVNQVTQAQEAGLTTGLTIGEEQKMKMVDNALKALSGPDRELEVSIHEKTHAIMVKVLNKDTGEVIREVPPEKTLDAISKLMEVAGILIDKKV
ncbi:flagellar protein FlaG [Paenibacillus pinistramenti]|uniref:flagellar protein FlaG n=1 Tax=Paenibacillus pinistramenti TaxID=1768003 RepID=UPI001109F81B|nr:flagellar protein FlaG [Paenibacillus pinistramenti]